MQNTFSSVLGLTIPLLLAATVAAAAPPTKVAEDRYIAARDAAIAKISAIYDAGNRRRRRPQGRGSSWRRPGGADAVSFSVSPNRQRTLNPPKLTLTPCQKADLKGFGTLDGLRFDARLGMNGETAGQNGADGKYVEPKSHIIVTTQTLFERWLRAHKDWWGKKSKNVPQQIAAALKDESFYTQAISSRARGGELQFAADRKAYRHQLRITPCWPGEPNPNFPTRPTTCSSRRPPMARSTSPMA